VAKGYTQVAGLDFEETFAYVARLESIRICETCGKRLCPSSRFRL
jgi:hypothetical protein